jgi:hypothetical protein
VQTSGFDPSKSAATDGDGETETHADEHISIAKRAAILSMGSSFIQVCWVFIGWERHLAAMSSWLEATPARPEDTS